MGWLAAWEPEQPEPEKRDGLQFYNAYFDEDGEERLEYYAAYTERREAWQADPEPLTNNELGKYENASARNAAIRAMQKRLLRECMDWIDTDAAFVAVGNLIRPTSMWQNTWASYCLRTVREERDFWRPLRAPDELQLTAVLSGLERLIYTRISFDGLQSSQGF